MSIDFGASAGARTVNQNAILRRDNTTTLYAFFWQIFFLTVILSHFHTLPDVGKFLLGGCVLHT